MSYGRYGMKMRYNPYTSPQEQLGESLGTVLGTIWGENYNRRGIEKGEQEALKALYGEGESSGAIGGPNGGSNNVPQELYQQAVGSGAIGASGNTPSAQASASTQPAAGGVIGASGDSGLNDRISAQDKIANEKWGILSAKYGSGTDNPDGDKKIIGQTASTINNNLSSLPRGQLPITDSKALSYSIEAQLRKNGRTDYQIQQIMKNIGPKLDSVVDSNKNAVWDNLYEQYKQQVQRGEYDASSVTMADMTKYNPERTKALQNQYNRNQNEFKTQYDLDQKIAFLKKNDSSLTDKQARNLAMYNSIYSPTEMAAMGYTPNGRGGYSAPRISASGGGAGGGRSRGGGGGTKAEKQAAWKDRVAWANSVLANENAAPEMKQSATRVLAAYDRAMAGDEYVMPYADVQRYVENAIGSGLLTPEQAYDWAFDDSGLGDDEARTLGMWIRENYMNNDNVSEGTREAFFNLGGRAAEEPEPQEQPNANGHTGVLASLESLGEAWDNFKLKDIANWVKNR